MLFCAQQSLGCSYHHCCCCRSIESIGCPHTQAHKCKSPDMDDGHCSINRTKTLSNPVSKKLTFQKGNFNCDFKKFRLQQGKQHHRVNIISSSNNNKRLPRSRGWINQQFCNNLFEKLSNG